MKTIFKKEFRSYFNNMSGYIFTAFMLLFAGIFTMATCLQANSGNFESVMGNMSIVYIFAIPVLTMRIISDDRRQKTDQLYYSMPIDIKDVVLGKYFAMLAVLAVPVVIIAIIPIILSFFGNLSLAVSFGTIFAYFLFGAAFIAVGMFISSLTENIAISAVITLLVVLVNWIISSIAELVAVSSNVTLITVTVMALILAALIWYMSKNGIAALVTLAVLEIAVIVLKIFAPNAISNFLPNLMNSVSLFDRYYAFLNGIFDIGALIYFAAVSVVFVYFTVQSMEKRRWS